MNTVDTSLIRTVFDITTKLLFIFFIIIHEKILHFDWLRAVQFLRNTVPKKKRNSVPKKRNSVQISLDFKFLNFLATHVYL